MPKYIELEKLRRDMYQAAFETDSDLQRWDSGCWIRYKLFEKVVDAQRIYPIDEVENTISDSKMKSSEWKRLIMRAFGCTGSTAAKMYHAMLTEYNKQKKLAIVWKCPGECDGCRYKKAVPGTDERINREPSYYCDLVFRKEKDLKDGAGL